MNNKSCPYSVLGIERNASEEQIKKAYRTKAIKLHPDKNQNNPSAEEEFKKLSEAYEILSDKTKKESYDMFGFNGPPNNNMNGFPNDIFNMFFNTNVQEQKPEPIYLTIEISLKELFTGTTKPIKYNRRIRCRVCDGTGSKTKKDCRCLNCGGTGIIKNVMNMGLIQHINANPCGVCKSTGSNIEDFDKCENCNGLILVEENVEQLLNIEKTVEFNKNISLFKKGHEKINSRTMVGDLIIKITGKPEKNWKREHDTSYNLLHSVTISLEKMLNDKYIYIYNINDEMLKVNIQDIGSNNFFKISDKGLYKDTNQRGDIHCYLTIILPAKVNVEEKEELFGENVVCKDSKQLSSFFF
jgi:DnaJ-class molecular chaperone